MWRELYLLDMLAGMDVAEDLRMTANSYTKYEEKSVSIVSPLTLTILPQS